MRMVGVILIIILLLLLLRPQTQEVSYPMVSIESMYCKNGQCRAVVRNSGNLTAFCKQIEIYVDNSYYGKLSDYNDVNGQSCEKIDSGRFVVMILPDFCSDHDRISLKTRVKNFLSSRNLEAIYTSNFICP